MKKPVVKWTVKLWGGLFVVGIMAGCHRSLPDPRTPARNYYTALSRQDWRAMYPLTAFSSEEKEVYKDADEFTRKMVMQVSVDDAHKEGFDYLKGLTEISVGTPVVSGDKADVPTSATLLYQGNTMRFHGVAHMLYEDGAWKFDTSASGTDVTAKAIVELLGHAEKH